MFNPFRLVIESVWPATGASSVPSSAPSIPASKAPPPNCGSTAQTDPAAPMSTASVSYPTLATPSTATSPSPPATDTNSTCATQTNFPTPHSSLGRRHVEPMNNVGVSMCHIDNIPAPRTPTFKAPISSSSASSQQTQSANTGDANMTEGNTHHPLTPPTTPSEDRDIPSASMEGVGHSTTLHTQAEEDDTINTTEKSTPTPTERDQRPRLRPKHQQDLRPKPKSSLPKRRASVSSIVVEEDGGEDPLPEGYSATWHGMRFYTPESYTEDHQCGYLNEHKLICGHWVMSDEPCGGNCETQNWDQQPFVCPTCRNIVQDTIQNQLTAAEKVKLGLFKDQADAPMIGYMVEYVTKRNPKLKGNITETVLSFVSPAYGRACEASEGPVPTMPVEELVKEIQEMRERDQKKKFARENPLNQHEKRKDMDDDAGEDTQAATEQPGAATSSPNNNVENQDASFAADTEQQHASSTNTNKKQKRTLETHSEPIPPQTRGTKRSPSPSESTATNIKKMKHKLETHHEPITPRTHGTKRAPSVEELFRPKKICLVAAPTFGDASYLTPPSSVVGPLIRKRDADGQIEQAIDAYSNKRRRSAVVLDGRDEEVRYDVWRPRAGLGEWIWDGEEEL